MMLTKRELLERGVTPETLNAMPEVIKNGPERYGQDEMFGDSYFTRALKAYPENTRSEIVMMKVALIDMTNSTNLSRLAGAKKVKDSDGKESYKKRLTIEGVVDIIVGAKDFDWRVKEGDARLVSEMTEKGAEQGLKLMSFFSKYCLYHNHDVYGRDDYSIYDSVVKDHFGECLQSDAEFEELLEGVKIVRKYGDRVFDEKEARRRTMSLWIGKMRDKGKYEAYNEMMGKFLSNRGITDEEVPDRRRKLDWYVWYLNRAEG